MLNCEDSSYLYRVVKGKNSFDTVYSFNIQNSYDLLECYDSFNLNFSENSRDCIDSYFLFDCRSCQNCFMCWNLRNKQYCIRNKQYSKEAYAEELGKIRFDSYGKVEEMKKEFENLLKDEAVHRENTNLRCTASVGNYLTDCDKCVNVFSWEFSQNCRNCLRGLRSQDCIDMAVSWNLENSGNNSQVNGGYAIKHSTYSIGKYSEYLDACNDVEYCFGCVGLKKKKYCILNKQYSRTEYEKLKEKIVKDMGEKYGEFLPYYFAPCDYNRSAGMIYFPEVTRQEIQKYGGYWQDDDLSSTDGVSSLELPDSIQDTEASISSQALICPRTHYRYNISPAEFQFHKNKSLALPREHFDQRILKKIRKTSVIKSYPYRCFYCQQDILAYYPPEWGYNKIACEECYKREIA